MWPAWLTSDAVEYTTLNRCCKYTAIVERKLFLRYLCGKCPHSLHLQWSFISLTAPINKYKHLQYKRGRFADHSLYSLRDVEVVSSKNIILAPNSSWLDILNHVSISRFCGYSLLMLVQRCRRWANIELLLVQPLVCRDVALQRSLTALIITVWMLPHYLMRRLNIPSPFWPNISCSLADASSMVW